MQQYCLTKPRKSQKRILITPRKKRNDKISQIKGNWIKKNRKRRRKVKKIGNKKFKETPIRNILKSCLEINHKRKHTSVEYFWYWRLLIE